VLEEIGVSVPSYWTRLRRLRVFAQDSRRLQLAAACATRAGLGPADLVLYDVPTLYVETDAAAVFREPGSYFWLSYQRVSRRPVKQSVPLPEILCPAGSETQVFLLVLPAW
jgi:hypothetical protein